MTEEIERGRHAQNPSEIPATGWRDVLWRVYTGTSDNNIFLVAGGVTFYLLLAVVPGLAAFVSLFGLFADPVAISEHIASLRGVLPSEGIKLLQSELDALLLQERGTLTFGFLLSYVFTFWITNNSVKAMLGALNVAYDEIEKRSFIQLTLASFAFTLAAMATVIVILTAIATIQVTNSAESPLHSSVLRILQWPVLMIMVALGLAVLYRYGPSRSSPKWRWVSWGSTLATVVWIASSFAFTMYLENFANYNATYGSLGALVGFLFWVWISVLIVIVGASLNAEMERQTAKDTTDPPDQEMGKRGAVVADTLGTTADGLK
ncbi:YihY/virulence factor BrkB family protein [Sedimentitalea todarodis]|uniref:YihY/virulence factor BrkB family protein n=1 Tax=Sedimentitalea todarodis TaxID=1631240 RepID=A0ABU3VL95_9RHOB|nr:YihY/virulence factor BrkB family protein [Sedimentitalea todarodis]MDU9006946.1 YihY/virulence factor BrkB family protein [Sedimentitalea todarodis]